MLRPDEPRDERGRWILGTALHALENNTPTSHLVALHNIKAAAGHKSTPPHVKKHLIAALNAKKYSVARQHLRDAINGVRTPPKTSPRSHSKHALSVRVATELVREAHKTLAAKRHNFDKQTIQTVGEHGGEHVTLHQARGALPSGHPARTHIGRAMAAISSRQSGNKAAALSHTKAALRALAAPVRLRGKVDVRTQRQIARRAYAPGQG